MEPKEVFHYFAKISGIPHGSGNTRELEAYCIGFAREHGLESFQDAYGNVMLFKKGSPGYEDSFPVILQGHLDMVCEKEPACPLDMEKEAISLRTDGAYIWADGTTLGGDDGIALAYILALLAAKDIKHPPIEALFTRDEEVGLRGARMLNASRLKGKYLINIDSEEEGILTVGCAGAVRVSAQIPISAGSAYGCAKIVRIGGLRGGHSGIDIDKNRHNAAKMLGILLDDLCRAQDIRVASVCAEGRLNVIPQTAEAVICFDPAKQAGIEDAVQHFLEMLKKECAAVEPEAFAVLEEAALPEICADAAGTRDVVFALMQAPSGVYAMDPDIPGMVRTSLNLGDVRLEERVLKMGFMIRSNTYFGKRILVRQLTLLMEHMGGEIQLEDDYPAWEYSRRSLLRDKMVQAYQDIYGEDPKVCSIHAGLECGILSEKLPGVDMVSFGPDLENVHSPAERMSVDSAKRCWEYLLHVLRLLK